MEVVIHERQNGILWNIERNSVEVVNTFIGKWVGGKDQPQPGGQVLVTSDLHMECIGKNNYVESSMESNGSSIKLMEVAVHEMQNGIHWNFEWNSVVIVIMFIGKWVRGRDQHQARGQVLATSDWNLMENNNDSQYLVSSATYLIYPRMH